MKLKMQAVILMTMIFVIEIPNLYSSEIVKFFNETYSNSTPKIISKRELAKLKTVAIKDNEILNKYILPRFTVKESNLETLLKEYFEENEVENQDNPHFIILGNSPMFGDNKFILHQEIIDLEIDRFAYNIGGLVVELENIFLDKDAISFKYIKPTVDKDSGTSIILEKSFGEKIYLSNKFTSVAYIELSRKLNSKTATEKYLILISKTQKK